MKKVRSIVAFVMALVCTVSFCFAQTPANTVFPLKDVDITTELGKSIEKLYDAGVVNGIPEADGTFSYKAENTITRAEFCKMINITFNFNRMADNKFPDVNPSQWYYIHVLPAIYYGYIKGKGDGTFGGTDNITREMVCVILDRIIDKKSDKEVVITDTVSDWARDAVENIVGLGYIPLEEDGKFRATEFMTRGEFALALDDFVVVEEPQKDEETNKKDEEKEDTSSSRPSVGSGSSSRPSGGSTGGGSSSGSSGGNTGSGNTGGGNTDSGNTDSGDTGNGDTGSGDIEVTPPAEPTYTITYNLDGGKLSGQKKSYKASDEDYILPTPAKAGHKFMGWFETEDADITSPVTVLASGSAEDKVFYAKWAYYHTIGYVLNPATYGESIPEESKGKFAEDDSTVVYKYTEYDEEFELPTPYRDDGFAFLGWYEPQEFMGTQAVMYSDEYAVTSIPQGTSGNKIYHAVWEDMELESMETYFAIEDAIFDISINREIGTLVLTDKSSAIIAIVEEALNEVVLWQEQNVIVSNILVRRAFAQEIEQIKEIIDSFTPEERTEFENAMATGLSMDTLDSMVNIFNINTNYGKN